MSRWLIADPHFGHEKVIKYEDRPFANAEEMNESLINNWNDVVQNNDQVFVLGDFALMINKEKIESIVRRLKGIKFLIKSGHHDDHSNKWWREVGFQEVSQYPILLDGFYILSHEPCYINDHMPFINIHGHWHRKTVDHPNFINVCVELRGYKPVNFDGIKEKYKSMLEGDV